MAKSIKNGIADEKTTHLKVKPVCKPDVQLKKSRRRIFNEHSIDLLYSFGYQSAPGLNLSVLKKNALLIAGNYLKFFNVETGVETFLPSTYGAGFSCTTVHPSTNYFAAAEKGPKFCINIITYPALDICKTLRNDQTLLPCCAMQFHPKGDLLITLSQDCENKICIWLWEFESMLYASQDSALPIYSLHFSKHEEDVFVVSGKGHITFWNVSSIRDDRDIISDIVVRQTMALLESEKIDIYCTVSAEENFLSAIDDGYLLFWNSKALSFDDAVRISMPEDKPCHTSYIHHIIMYVNIFLTLGSDGFIKVWDYNDIVNNLASFGNESNENNNNHGEEDDFTETETEIRSIYINPVQEIFISPISDLVYGVVIHYSYDFTRYLIQDKNGVLYQAEIANDFSKVDLVQLLIGAGNNLIGLSTCPVFPFVAIASSLGSVVVYNSMTKDVFKSKIFPHPITSILWPSEKEDLFNTTFFVGFSDGSLRWIALADEDENYILKFVIKPHTDSIQFLKMNEDCTLLISQGLDSKLFFFSVENFSLIPLGFYINQHEVIDFAWLKYGFSPGECKETLLILCKYSYLIETEVPNSKEFREPINMRKSYFIENKNCQVYKINGLRKYHELGDRIHDSDCEEQSDLNDAGKEVLRRLKYREKKETRESRRFELGLCGALTSPEILSFLPSINKNCIWLSLGKDDIGYLFEFEFRGEFDSKPVELIPIRALEILTAEIIPVLSMLYSPCGKFIFMGLRDGSLNICFLEHAFKPDTGYDFAKYQIHDPDMGGICHIAISPKGSIITTAGCDGNVLSFNFQMLDYKTFKEWERKPRITDTNKVEDILPEKLPVEDELQYSLRQKYLQMKVQRSNDLATLKEVYVNLVEQYTEYAKLCDESLTKFKSVPEELKLNLENYCMPSTAIEMFSKTTKRLIQDIRNKYHKDIVKASLMFEKYFNFFKLRIEEERNYLKCPKGNSVLSTFRNCKLPPNIKDVQLIDDFKMYKPEATVKDSTNEEKKKKKINKEKLNLEQELVSLSKAIIDYPGDTPVSELVSKFNSRKEERIKMLKEQIRELEILDGVAINDEKCKEAVEEIKNSQFHFKDCGGVERNEIENMCTFAEKKTETASYCVKVHKYAAFFNSMMHTSIASRSLSSNTDSVDLSSKEEKTRRIALRKDMHIYFKKGKKSNKPLKFPEVDWTQSYTEVLHENHNNTEKEESSVAADCAKNFHKQLQIVDEIQPILLAAKPKFNCEKRFQDIRFILKCIELNIFKLDMMVEKKLLKTIIEVGDQLQEENTELSALEKKKLALKSNRQLEKVEWINIYNQFRKAIGYKNKHKGYFKQVFKKKIRSDEEKEPYKRHPSSESSESEEDIGSDDDNQEVDKSDIDQNVLKEVMYFRLRRHEVEKRMKEYKRNLIADSSKEAVLLRKIQRIKDSLEEAWNELKLIPVNRKQALKKLTWPVVLYPENVHKEFFRKQISSIEEQKKSLYEEMSVIHKTISKELKPVYKLIRIALAVLSERIVKAELNDLVAIASVFFPLVDCVAEEVDEYFKKLLCVDDDDTLKKSHIVKEKPVNIIYEILSAADVEFNLKMKKCDKIDSVTEAISPKVEEPKILEEINEDGFQEHSVKFLFREKAKDSDLLFEREVPLKSWRDVGEDDQISQPTKKTKSDFDINKYVNPTPTLDISFLCDENLSSQSEDYYMQELHLNIDVNHKEIKPDGTELKFEEYAEMLGSLDINDTLEDIIYNISENASMTSKRKTVYEFFPTHRGGGLVLTENVLVAMENEDPDSFPYTKFYQEPMFIEELVEKPKVVHIVPLYKEKESVYDMPLPFEDFIILSKKTVLNSLNTYHYLRDVTTELQEQIKFLEKKVSQSKSEHINVEQKLLALMRERTEEISKKFSSMVDLEHLLDVIENPHLRIKKYENDLKIDSMKKDLIKIKAAEVTALKSLDKLGFEDTKICHELLKLRKEFRSLNKNYSFKLLNIPSTRQNFPSDRN